jgi:hypothetical protein
MELTSKEGHPAHKWAEGMELEWLEKKVERVE